MSNTILISAWCIVGFAAGAYAGFGYRPAQIMRYIVAIIASPFVPTIGIALAFFWALAQLSKGEAWLAQRFPRR